MVHDPVEQDHEKIRFISQLIQFQLRADAGGTGILTPHITSVQYCGGCSVHWRLFSTSGG